MVMESYDCDLWRRYTWETAKFRFYGRPAYRGARQWTAKCTYGAVLPPNNDTRKRRKSPWGPMGPSPVPRDSRFFFFFLSSSLFLYSVYDIPCRIVSNEYMRGCFERFRRWLCVKKMKKFGERNTKFLFLWGFEVFGYVRFESFFFFLMQKKLSY